MTPNLICYVCNTPIQGGEERTAAGEPRHPECPADGLESDAYDALGEDWTDVRKKPVEVEAKRAAERVRIDTREGTVVAEPGDVVIRGVEGEVYPCDPDIFAATYEVAE